MSATPTLTATLLAAAGPAAALALVFGLRDATRALRMNTWVNLQRFLGVYVALPVVALSVLLLPVVVVGGFVGRAARLPPAALAAGVGGGLTVLFLGVDVLASVGALRASLRRVDAPSGTRRWSVGLVAAVLGAGALAAAALVAVAARMLHDSMVPLAAAATANLLLAPMLAVIVVREVRQTHAATAFRRARPAHATVGRPRPSVILISIDTLRADRLRAFGGRRDLMPNLDGLAARGVRLENAIAQSSWTLPSVASFLSGLTPRRHGAGWPLNGFDLLARAPLPAGTWTLATALRAAGYRTQAIVSNPYLAPQFGLSEGFDSYDNVSLESEVLLCFRTTLAGRLLGPLLRSDVAGNGAVVTARALRRLPDLQAAAHREPYFLWLHYIDPHAPYGCGGTKSFRGDTLLSEVVHTETKLDTQFEAIARLRAGEIRLSAAERARLIDLYDAGVADVDRQIGRVLAQAPPGDDTLVVVVSDHGEEFWEHGGVEHGHTCYEELVRVPALLAGAGLPAATPVPGVTRLVDLPPTIVSLLGLPTPEGIDGRSLVRGRAGLAAPGEPALCEGMLFAEEKVAVRTDRYKYVRSANGKEELYDLAGDPAELRDVAAGADLEWARALVAGRPAEQSHPSGSSVSEEASVRAALGALGYV